MWYVIGYLVVAFILMGSILDTDKTENIIREWGVSFLVGLIWPIVILIGIGAFVVGNIIDDDANSD